MVVSLQGLTLQSLPYSRTSFHSPVYQLVIEPKEERFVTGPELDDLYPSPEVSLLGGTEKLEPVRTYGPEVHFRSPRQ